MSPHDNASASGKHGRLLGALRGIAWWLLPGLAGTIIFAFRIEVPDPAICRAILSLPAFLLNLACEELNANPLIMELAAVALAAGLQAWRPRSVGISSAILLTSAAGTALALMWFSQDGHS